MLLGKRWASREDRASSECEHPSIWLHGVAVGVRVRRAVATGFCRQAVSNRCDR